MQRLSIVIHGLIQGRSQTELDQAGCVRARGYAVGGSLPRRNNLEDYFSVYSDKLFEIYAEPRLMRTTQTSLKENSA